MDFGKALGTLASFFEREGYRYAAVGAFGLHAYGLARATLDLDLATESAAQPKLVAFLESLGYDTLYRSAGYSNHVHALPDLGRLDFVYVYSETGRLLFSGGATLQLGEHRVPVPRPEHLVAMKVHTMKNDPSRTLREMADIQFLLSLPRIDEAEVARTSSRAGSWSATVTSSDSADRLELNRGLPTTAADVVALRRLGAPRPIDLEAYLRFLQAIGDAPADLLRARHGPKGPPFELRPRE